MSVDLLRPRFLPDRDTPREWGGKGAALARMIRRGFRVPPTAAFGRSEVRGWLEALGGHAEAVREWREGRGEGSLAAFRERVLAAPMPEHFPKSVETLRRLLAGEQDWPLILRSSVSAEDGAEASLAGCFASVVSGKPRPEAVWDAFRRVVASAFEAGSARRLLASGVDPARLGVAVVVQPLLEARLSGVAFSREPRDPWTRTGAVEWVEGGAEKLVQGTAPARARREAEGASAELAPFWEELWTRARLAEGIVGGPADVEWIWDGEQLWFVQARAVATEEARLAARAPARRWSRALTLERFPEPLTPMGWSALQDSLRVNLTTLERRFGVVARSPEDMAIAVRGVVYSDPGFFSFPKGVRVRFRQVLAPWRAAPWKALAAVARFAGRALAGRGGALSRALLGLDLADAFLASEARAIEAGWDRHRDGSCEEIRRFEAEEAGPARDGAELERRIARLGGVSARFMEPDLAVFLIKDTTRKALEAVWRAAGNPEAAFPDLVRSFQGNRTLEMSRDWSQLVARVGEDGGAGAFVARLGEARSLSAGLEAGGALGAAARAAWTDFLERDGHTTTSWDLAVPTWSEDPSRLAPLLAASLAAPARERRSAAPSSLREEGRARLARSLEAAGLGRAVPRAEAALARLESFMRMDEEHHFLSGLLLGPSRRLVLDGGRLLAASGVLAAAEDVFFLTLPELRRALAGDRLALAPLAERRRSELERARKTEPPFRLPPDAETAAPPAGETAGGWNGLPMSPGIAVGRVAIAEHIEDARGVAPGTILVTTSPNPALTPIYPLLGGLISSTGGALSHGFVSAREYALPAVSGIDRATARIPAGALVRVDGGSGRVELLEGDVAG